MRYQKKVIRKPSIAPQTILMPTANLAMSILTRVKKEKAAVAYYEAAVILVQKEQASRARSLLGLLRYLDKNRAGDLQELIESVES